MALLDYVSDAVNRFLPQKREKIPAPLSTSTGGIGHGVYNHEEDMILSRFTLTLHSLQIFFMFITMCCFASLAAFQAKWIGGASGLSGLVIFITIICMILSGVLIAIPVVYEKYDKLIRLARALRETRVQFIVTGAGVVIVPLVAMIVTISAWTQAGCKNADNDPHEKLGDDFKNALPGFCRTKKAGAIFLWLAAAAYIGSFVYVFYNWRRGKSTYNSGPRDPPFVHPEDPSHDMEDAVEDPYTRRRISDMPPRIPDEASSPFDDSNRYSGYGAPGRQSMDPYGAFNDDAPSGFDAPPKLPPVSSSPTDSPGMSRTMQSIYNDPYAAARGRVAQAAPPSPPGYSNYGGGYR